MGRNTRAYRITSATASAEVTPGAAVAALRFGALAAARRFPLVRPGGLARPRARCVVGVRRRVAAEELSSVPRRRLPRLRGRWRCRCCGFRRGFRRGRCLGVGAADDAVPANAIARGGVRVVVADADNVGAADHHMAVVLPVGRRGADDVLVAVRARVQLKGEGCRVAPPGSGGCAVVSRDVR